MNLLYLEWKKFAPYRLFQVITVLFIVLFPLMFLVGTSFKGLPSEIGSPLSYYSFPKVWEAAAYAGNWMVFFFLGFLGVLIITNEISYKTLRQNLITGMSREEYFLEKFYLW
jgi:hypothetical protein